MRIISTVANETIVGLVQSVHHQSRDMHALATNHDVHFAMKMQLEKSDNEVHRTTRGVQRFRKIVDGWN
jgi:hypothetical protein